MSHPYRVPHLKWFALSTVLNQEVIGRGSFGVVRKGVLRESDRVRPGMHSCAVLVCRRSYAIRRTQVVAVKRLEGAKLACREIEVAPIFGRVLALYQLVISVLAGRSSESSRAIRIRTWLTSSGPLMNQRTRSLWCVCSSGRFRLSTARNSARHCARDCARCLPIPAM